MAWTTPKSWSTGNALTASDMNTYIRDNQNALKDPPTDHYECDEATDYTTTSTSFVDVDATNLSLSITTAGGDVMVGFVGSAKNGTADKQINIDITVDGVRVGGDDGIVIVTAPTANARCNISFTYLLTGLGAATYTIKLQWKVEAGTATLHNGGGAVVMHPQFWVREV